VPINIPAPAGKVLVSDGTQYIDQYPPGHLLADQDPGGTSTNQGTVEQSVLASNAAISNMFPAMIAVGDAVHIRAAGTWLNNSATQTLTLNLYMGTVVIAAATVNPAVAVSANTRAWLMDILVKYSVSGDGTGGRVRPCGTIYNVSLAGSPSTGGFLTAAALTDVFFNDGSQVTVLTNAAQNCDLKAKGSAANASSGTVVTCNLFRATYQPKNY
jgi:hypothetical protein